jgi:type II restriction enzyme
MWFVIKGAPEIGYEAAEGIDWVWERRIDDLAQYGI